LHTSCIRLPCPINQQQIDKAEIAIEFEGLLRSLGSLKRNQRHLVINVQDRTSWREYARCNAVEEAQKKTEFENTLIVATLPKDTDFYLQSGSYVEWDDAAEFTKLLKSQVESGEECGFFIPPGIHLAELLEFVDKAIKTIHTLFFAGKDRLLHKNRLDFIEIFYLFFSLKLIEEFKPDSFSFTCKDAVDTGSAASAEMFALLRMMNDSSHFSKVEEDFLLWMVYGPALLVRDRAIDIQRFNRMTSALAIVAGEVEAHYHEVVAACSKLYKQPFFKGTTVKAA
jgi:hypothetical protein